MRKYNEQSLADALEAMLKEYKLKSRLDETRVETIWRERMGKSISTYTAEIAVRKKVLYLTILSAPLRQELSYSKDKIMMLMNQELGDGYITEVVIQ